MDDDLVGQIHKFELGQFKRDSEFEETWESETGLETAIQGFSNIFHSFWKQNPQSFRDDAKYRSSPRLTANKSREYYEKMNQEELSKIKYW